MKHGISFSCNSLILMNMMLGPWLAAHNYLNRVTPIASFSI